MKLNSAFMTISFACLLFSFSCSDKHKEINIVKPFELERYQGKWYEIARKDFYYERNLSNVTATYTLKPDGTVKVDNRGFNVKSKKWKQAVGKAKFAGSKDEGMLKVSFFGPFYSAYNVVALDSSYNYVLVAGKNLDYLWILSRKTAIPEDIKNDYLRIARDMGYKTDDLIWTEHVELK